MPPILCAYADNPRFCDAASSRTNSLKMAEHANTYPCRYRNVTRRLRKIEPGTVSKFPSEVMEKMRSCCPRRPQPNGSPKPAAMTQRFEKVHAPTLMHPTSHEGGAPTSATRVSRTADFATSPVLSEKELPQAISSPQEKVGQQQRCERAHDGRDSGV
jgi:hypothetical protein